jgi:glycosyltransferase involved in cell wall biosynthesis
MNVLMLNYEYPPLGGGGGVLNQQLAEELSQKNQITLITSRFANQPCYEIRRGVEIFRVPVLLRHSPNAASLLSMFSFFPTSLRTGYRLLNTRHFDLVHSMFAIPSAPSGFLLAKRFCLPHVLSILGGDVYDPSKRLSPHCTPLLHATVKKLLADSDRVVGMSSDIVARAVAHYGVSRPIEVIPHGIQRPLFAPKTRADLGYSADAILLTTVGRLIPRKAVHELLAIVREVPSPKVHLVIIGDGPERPKLEALAQSWQVTDRVHFLGNISDEAKFQMLNIADIYLSSTQHEGFGLVFLEAMAVGLPIVSYDNGGQVDFLVDEQTGFLVKLGDHQSLAQRTQTLIDNGALRQRIGQFNRQHVEDYYIASCSRKYQVLYDALVSAPR